MDELYRNIRKRRLEIGMTQKELAEKCGYKDHTTINKIEKRIRPLDDGYLFTKADGNLYTKSAYKRLQARVWGDSGRTFYDLRHYRATELYYLCQKGIISTKAAAKLLGHSEIIFLKTYSHIDPSKENLDQLYL